MPIGEPVFYMVITSRLTAFWIALTLAAILAFSPASAPAQTSAKPAMAEPMKPSAAPLQFDVASVRMVPPGRGYTKLSPSGADRFTATNVSLPVLLQFAFGIDDNQITGRPEWLDGQNYDVNAKPEGDAGLTYEEIKLPLQRLLVQRFHLAFRREIREVQGFALVLAKSGPKLQPAKGEGTHAYILPDGLDLKTVSLDFLASILARPLGHPVVDKTGIAGMYDLKLSYAPEGATDSQLPSIFTALEEQLGLHLKPQKVPLDMLVIDHVERVPTEN